MPNFCYVKNEFGTCNTDVTYSTKQAVAFGSGNLSAGNVYNTIADAYLYATLGIGDFICVSNVHHYNHTGDYIIYKIGRASCRERV